MRNTRTGAREVWFSGHKAPSSDLQQASKSQVWWRVPVALTLQDGDGHLWAPWPACLPRTESFGFRDETVSQKEKVEGDREKPSGPINAGRDDCICPQMCTHMSTWHTDIYIGAL